MDYPRLWCPGRPWTCSGRGSLNDEEAVVGFEVSGAALPSKTVCFTQKETFSERENVPRLRKPVLPSLFFVYHLIGAPQKVAGPLANPLIPYSTHSILRPRPFAPTRNLRSSQGPPAGNKERGKHP